MPIFTGTNPENLKNWKGSKVYKETNGAHYFFCNNISLCLIKTDPFQRNSVVYDLSRLILLYRYGII